VSGLQTLTVQCCGYYERTRVEGSRPLRNVD